jgi:hypothetical protein
MTDESEFFGEPIFSYTRKQALEDGVLKDVTATAQEAGWKWPVAVSSALWNLIVPSAELEAEGQSTDGRLWDVVWMASMAAKGMPDVLEKKVSDREFWFNVILPQRRTDKTEIKHSADPEGATWTFKVVSGPGDDMEPVVTMMLTNED